MPIVFNRGAALGSSDLSLSLKDSNGSLINPSEISYDIYYVDPGPPETEVLIPDPSGQPRTPVNPSTGEYYASFAIPPGAALGEYRIRWIFKETIVDPVNQVVQVFSIVDENTQTANNNYNTAEKALIRRMRFMLRDNNPDRNYRFMPPEHESDVGSFNQVFGYVWEDEELYEYLATAVEWWDIHPPATSLCTVTGMLGQKNLNVKVPVLHGAMWHALTALAINWSHEEFDYSIGGISLSIDKASKYEGLAGSVESKWDQALESKINTHKYFKGLSRPRFAGRTAMDPHNVAQRASNGYPAYFSY
jgi:hypothetical protein